MKTFTNETEIRSVGPFIKTYPISTFLMTFRRKNSRSPDKKKFGIVNKIFMREPVFSIINNVIIKIQDIIYGILFCPTQFLSLEKFSTYDLVGKL